MMRQSLLWLSEQQGVFRFIKRNGLARKFASRFVAGETVDSAIEAVRHVNAQDISASLDLLGESVSNEAEAEAAADQYLGMLDAIAATRVQANVSLKLTQMGLDISGDVCYDNVARILRKAKALDTFVRLDMESSEYTQRTLDFFYHRLFDDFADVTGVVIQSCLRRSEADIEDLVARGARVRLCKGAYLEPPSVAFPDKADVDRNYVRLMERLLAQGNYPAIATHDEAMLSATRQFAAKEGIGTERFEFQMLYGVRRDLQAELRQSGYNMRVYIPFGTQWYPYLMRRLAERPANIAFMLGNVVKETVSGR